MTTHISEKVLSGASVTPDDIAVIIYADLNEVRAEADRIRQTFRGNAVELCAIVNAKSGLCPEDCAYCAQSSHHRTGVVTYPLMDEDEVLARSREARDAGVHRFSIVTSGARVSQDEMRRIGRMIGRIRETGVTPCASLGMLTRDDFSYLRDCGLDRYHCNIETSERFFPSICSTHSFKDKLDTIEHAKAVGLSVCAGGILGMGESWDDRIAMALTLRDCGVDSVPLNFLVPIEGTALGGRPFLLPSEALRIIALFRFLLPDKEIRVCGGRIQALGEHSEKIFAAGADCLMTGNYLTTAGMTYADDVAMIGRLGLRLK